MFPLFLVTISPELDHPLKILREQLNFLTGVLSFPAFRRIWRAVCCSYEPILGEYNFN